MNLSPRATGGPSSSSEMIILRNWSYVGIDFYSSQRRIGHVTAHTWERGWGRLVLNLSEHFWWNSYVRSKIVRFLRKMDGLIEISIKLILLPNRKESSVPLLVVQIHFMAPMVCLRAFTSSSLCTEACIFAKYLSFYTYLILCEYYGWG